MSRWYSVEIAGAPGSYGTSPQWTSHRGGQRDPGAQQVEFQIEELSPHIPNEGSNLVVYGVSFQQIKDANQLIGCPVTIRGGMKPGLPVETAQGGKDDLLIQSTILKCWGNWIGTEMSLGITFNPGGQTSDAGGGGGNGGGGGGNGGGGGGNGGGGTPSSQQVYARSTIRYNRIGPRSLDNMGFGDIPRVSPRVSLGSLGGILSGGGFTGAATSSIGGVISSFFGGGTFAPLQAPLNFIHNMMPNMPLMAAIQETLSRVFPKAKLNINISPNLMLGYQDAGMYQAFEQYATYINQLSKSINKDPNYPGVKFGSNGNQINVFDGSGGTVSSGRLGILDLIGQPVWLDRTTVSIKSVLRGDIHIGETVSLPSTLMTLSGPNVIIPGTQSDQRTNVSTPGTFTVTRVLYIGDFRNPDGASWSSNYEATKLAQGASPL